MSSSDGVDAVVQRLRLAEPAKPEIPRLYYFDARGRGEIIRLIFALKGISYEDLRCSPHPYAMRDFEILKARKRLPFGQVPLLEIDGMALAQSQAIVRYLARKYGLIGATEAEAALADMVGCATEDIRQKFTSSILNWKELEAEPILCKFETEICPQWGRYLETLLGENGGEWFVGRQLTWADLSVYDMMGLISLRIPGAFEQFPLLKAFTTRVEQIPRIAQWLASRPQTPV